MKHLKTAMREYQTRRLVADIVMPLVLCGIVAAGTTGVLYVCVAVIDLMMP